MLEAELRMALALHTPLHSDRGALRNALHTPGMNAPTVPHRLPGHLPGAAPEWPNPKRQSEISFGITRPGLGEEEISFESSSTVVWGLVKWTTNCNLVGDWQTFLAKDQRVNILGFVLSAATTQLCNYRTKQPQTIQNNGMLGSKSFQSHMKTRRSGPRPWDSWEIVDTGGIWSDEHCRMNYGASWKIESAHFRCYVK